MYQTQVKLAFWPASHNPELHQKFQKSEMDLLTSVSNM